MDNCICNFESNLNQVYLQNQEASLGLVYADVGPLSFKQRQVNADLRVFDDDRVQYAQVDLTRLQKTPKKTEPVNVDKRARE